MGNASRAYDAYCAKYRPQEALIEGGCRGGFGDKGLDELIPGWRDGFLSIAKLQKQVDKLIKQQE